MRYPLFGLIIIVIAVIVIVNLDVINWRAVLPRFFLSQVVPGPNEAAFYFSPDSGEYEENDIFAVELRINTSAAITSIKAYLNFDQTNISVTNLDPTASVFSTEWENTYNNTTGEIKMQRSEPTPGHNGDGLIAEITFQATNSGEATISYDASCLALKSDDTNILNLTISTEASFTINEPEPPPSDSTPPYTTGHNPAKGTTDVASSTNIVVQVKDAGAGVDISSIVMQVEGIEVTPTITGSSANYTLTYNPPTNFSYDQVVNVTVDADDLAVPANTMTQDNYSFTVESAPVCTDCGLGTPTTNPTTPEAGQSFTISCPANSNTYDCINAYANSNECVFSNWSGNNALFDCSGLTVGNHTAKCEAITGTGSSCCADEKTNSFSVVDSTAPVRYDAYPTGILASGTTEINISLTTNETATCRYSTSAGTSYDAMTNTFSETGSVSHSNLITGLSSGSSYAFYVRCQDSSNNKNTDDLAIEFSVSEPPPSNGGDGGGGGAADTTAPNISNVQVSILSESSVSITWTTDEISTSQVECGTTEAYGSFTTLDPSLVTAHKVKLTKLTTKTLYYFRVISEDNSGNKAVSEGKTFRLLVGDFNGDGKVNIFDFSILLSNWKKNKPAYDLNQDGIINIFDLSILLSNWFK